MKVLSIIQLPIELGGSYTTGVARVGEGLYKEHINGVDSYWYFTNVSDGIAQKIDNNGGHYLGYKFPIWRIMCNVALHPIKTIKEWIHYKKICKKNPFRFEFYKANLQDVIHNVHPDLIHMHSDGMAPLSFALEKEYIPILMTFHGIMFEPSTGVWDQDRDDLLDSIKKANYYTALNKDVLRKALFLGVDENKIYVVPNGTNCSKFYFSLEKRELIRKELRVTKECIVFITVGSVFDRKGQYDFILYLEKLGINYQYWIIGKGPDCDRICEYVAAHSLQSRVILLGYVGSDDLYGYLSASDIYAHVSTTEGQAMSEIEAYSTGLPTIVRNVIKDTVIGNPQDISHYFVSKISPSVDKKERQDVINWIKTVGEETRTISSSCDWSVVSQRYGGVYKDILERDKVSDN